MFKKNILIGITGSIAAYKMPDCARRLMKDGCDVQILMTKNALEFIAPLSFESLTKHKALYDTFDRNFTYNVEHVATAKWADCILIAPASADVIGKLANGIADDMLTTTVMAATCPKIIAPAMNHNMYHNPVVQDNLEKLKKYGWIIIPPEHGILANGDTGDGRMPDIDTLCEWVRHTVYHKKDLAGKKILVTAGATREKIDPVRFISNYSTGKMGCAVAAAAAERGADVTLVTGNITVKPPLFVNIIHAESAADMYNVCTEKFPDMDITVMTAAVADYTPETVAKEKIKKYNNNNNIKLKRTEDILKTLGKIKKSNQILVGFSMETENIIENSQKKLIEKNADLICANSLRDKNAGFGTDTNVVTFITENANKKLPVMSKRDIADKILDYCVELNLN